MNLKLINTTIKNKLFLNTPSIIFKFGNFLNTKPNTYYIIHISANNYETCQVIIKILAH